MDTLELNGRWMARASGSDDSFPAEVPGGIHNDLLKARRIPDPYPGTNEADVEWVGETDWIFERTFEVRAEVLRRDRVLMVCEGLDTIAAVRINDRPVAKTDNMFRRWEFDVKRFLRAGTNSISVEFTSALTYTRALNRKRKLPGWGVGTIKLGTGGWIRKEPCNFGWDWGPKLVTCGIWRDIRIVSFDVARLTDMHMRQRHLRGDVALSVAVTAETVKRGSLSCAISVTLGRRVVAEARVPVRRGAAKAEIRIRDPKLWWPNGMGDQPLYEVNVDLMDSDGDLLDTTARRIGLRTLALERKKDRWGESFNFSVNGKAFFAKGANWIPADAVLARLTFDDYRRLISDAAAANMNMLRVWGGGIYEDDAFYELCDEMGICIWQDFMFACATYPSFDGGFMANVKAEAEDNVRRIRHHACLALWCGNNEIEQGLVGERWTDRAMSWRDYKKLFDRLLPSVVRRLNPDTAYWPCSPHSPHGNRMDFNNPRCGDAHLWSVWHGRKPFEWYRTCEHRFNSEFGFQSFPEPSVVKTYAAPGQRNITSPVMEWHQRSGIGNAVIVQYMLDWFRMPDSFENMLWLSQILQGMAMKYAVEHWRRSMPRGMGTLYWQLNDCWPVASWSSIDYPGNWKALHYMARRFYAPVLASGIEDAEAGTVELHVTNDRLKPFSGNLEWRLTDLPGKRLAGQTVRVNAGGRKSVLVETVELSEVVRCMGAENLILWFELSAGGSVVSSDAVTLAKPKRMELPDPRFKVRSSALGKEGFEVNLRAGATALWAWLEVAGARARFSDNFFHVSAGRDVTVAVSPERNMTAAEFAERLRVRSLVDTYR